MKWQINYRKKLRKEAWEAIGKACVFCGKKRKLHMAHIKSTGLSGPGRGSVERYKDVIKNPDDYEPMCPHCHRVYDRIKPKPPEPEIPF